MSFLEKELDFGASSSGRPKFGLWGSQRHSALTREICKGPCAAMIVVTVF